ncbi:hypothetical protein HMSSN036_72730 [Paenibacillus macerans]|nr:hypothetical protein HMSSN036_72730 [Paenibacillus macerans]
MIGGGRLLRQITGVDPGAETGFPLLRRLKAERVLSKVLLPVPFGPISTAASP